MPHQLPPTSNLQFIFRQSPPNPLPLPLTGTKKRSSKVNFRISKHNSLEDSNKHSSKVSGQTPSISEPRTPPKQAHFTPFQMAFSWLPPPWTPTLFTYQKDVLKRVYPCGNSSSKQFTKISDTSVTASVTPMDPTFSGGPRCARTLRPISGLAIAVKRTKKQQPSQAAIPFHFLSQMKHTSHLQLMLQDHSPNPMTRTASLLSWID